MKAFSFSAVCMTLSMFLIGATISCPFLYDRDRDGIPDNEDNCPHDYNPDQQDSDGDRWGDACDTCIGNGPADSDGDSTCDGDDNCISINNPDQADEDSDGVGNWCDNCVSDTNPDQIDQDSDGWGDVCDSKWAWIFGDDGKDEAYDALFTDAGVIVAGTLEENGTHVAFLREMEEVSGELLWQIEYPIADPSVPTGFYALARTETGYIAAGSAADEGYVVVVDSAGNIIHSFTYPESTVINDVQYISSDNKAVIVGATVKNGVTYGWTGLVDVSTGALLNSSVVISSGVRNIILNHVSVLGNEMVAVGQGLDQDNHPTGVYVYGVLGFALDVYTGIAGVNVFDAVYLELSSRVFVAGQRDQRAVIIALHPSNQQIYLDTELTLDSPAIVHRMQATSDGLMLVGNSGNQLFLESVDYFFQEMWQVLYGDGGIEQILRSVDYISGRGFVMSGWANFSGLDHEALVIRADVNGMLPGIPITYTDFQ